MRLRRLLLGLAVLGVSTLAVQADQLVILHTNDTHSQIDPMADGYGGVHRRKALIDSVRNARENVLLIDAGDIVQGTLFFNIYKGILEEELMNHLEYDIRILGNHEFDNGMQTLADNLSIANADLLCSNYDMSDTPLSGIFQPYALREVSGRVIAFMPINLQPEGMIPPANYEGMGYVDALQTAEHMAWYLRNIIGADMVVALTHIGYSGSPESDLELIKASHDIDLLIGGHSHTLIDPDTQPQERWLVPNADGRLIPVAQTGSRGKNVGEIVIDLDVPKVVSTRLISVDARWDDRIDPTVEEIIRPYRHTVDSLNSNMLAHAARTLERDKPALLNYMSDFVAIRGREMADSVDFAILNKGGLRQDLQAGDVAEGQLISLMPFCNHIEVLDISGDALLRTFDVMAAGGGNGISSEVKAVYDPKSRKCTKVLVNGKLLDPEATYRIATIDYLSNGGDYMTPLTEHERVARSPQMLYEDLVAYIKAHPGTIIDASDVSRWSQE